MTTIVYDGIHLAVDSRTTAGSTIIKDDTVKLHQLTTQKAYRGEEIVRIAATGVVADIQRALILLDEGQQEWDTEECTLVILTTKNLYVVNNNIDTWMRVDYSHAWGSGADYARSALSFNLDAVEAVKHAMKFDSQTGGKINKIKMPWLK